VVPGGAFATSTKSMIATSNLPSATYREFVQLPACSIGYRPFRLVAVDPGTKQ
jgi:hypothetical protein